MFPIAVTGRHTHGYGPEEQQTLGHVEIEAVLYRTHVVGFPRPHRSLQRRSRHHVLHEQANSHQLHHLRTVQVVRPFGRAHRTIAAVRQSFVLHPPAEVPEEPRFLLEITAYLAYIVNGTVGCFGRILNRYGFPLLSVRERRGNGSSWRRNHRPIAAYRTHNPSGRTFRFSHPSPPPSPPRKTPGHSPPWLPEGRNRSG